MTLYTTRRITLSTIFALLCLSLTLLAVSSTSHAETPKMAVVAYHVDLRVQVFPLPVLKQMAAEAKDHGDGKAKAAELDEMQRIVIDLDTNDAVSFDNDPEAIPEAPSGDDDEYGRPWDVFYGALLSCRVPFT